MNIIWSPEAIQDLVAFRAYIVEQSPAGARRVVLRVIHDVERLLPDNPHIGRPGPPALYSRTGDSTDALYRTLPRGTPSRTDFARLSHGLALA